MTRDTERMVLSDVIYAADEPAGWALIKEPTAKEERYCRKMNLEIIRADVTGLLEAAGVEFSLPAPHPEQVLEHTRAHFDAEDRLMAEHGFPATSEHQNEHQRVLGEMTRFRNSVHKGLIVGPVLYWRESDAMVPAASGNDGQCPGRASQAPTDRDDTGNGVY